jgi:multidrug efflux system membrane fusion protein
VALTGTLPITRQTIGWITSPAAISLTSPQAGLVTQLVGTEGQEVKKGDLIAKLDDRVAQAAVAKDAAQIQLDQATFSQAGINASRARTLFDKGAGTRQALDDADTASKTAAAAVAADNAQLAADQVILANMEMRAPFDGRLGAFQVAVGSLVQPATAVVTLTQMTPLRVSFSLTQADLGPLQSAVKNGGQSVSVVSTTAPNSSGKGSVDFIDSSIDQGSGTFKAMATFPNDSFALWPGESVSITVDLGSTGPLVLVPSQAVQAAASGFEVYVVKQDQTIDARPVTVGLATAGQTGISAGLQPGEHVVTEGQIQLTTGMKVAETTAATLVADGTPVSGATP